MRIRSGVACPKGGGAAVSSACGRLRGRARRLRRTGARQRATGAWRAGGWRRAGGCAAARTAKTVTIAA
ncbi:hypothetical protein CO709_23215 [Burkholderia thailandensis]|nr:hypothetical protein CO709_23215 [Burkholderia thailandensis]